MPGVYSGLFLLSAGTLLFEIALSRIFSIAHGYHFAFMAVGLALLGAGASGSFLQLGLARLTKLERHLSVGGILFAIGSLGGYLACNLLPFDSFRLGWDRVQFAYLAAYFLALAVPFFIAGGTFGLILALRPQEAGKLYFANLLGGGMGALGALIVLSLTRAEAAVIWAAFLGLGAAAAFRLSDRHRRGWAEMALVGLAIALLALVARPWPFLAVRLSPYKPLRQLLRAYDAQHEGTWWNAISRADVVKSSTIHSTPGLSLGYSGPIPSQKGLLLDGDNLYPITASAPQEAAFLDHMPLALPYLLTSPKQVLILRPGGGLAALAAVRYGVQEIVAVEPNPLVVNLFQGTYREDSLDIYVHPNLRVMTTDERSFLTQDPARYDLVHLALSDNFRAVTWGAYSLREDFLYTVEAFAAAFQHLESEGCLIVERWLQLPPSEETRAWGTLVVALEQSGVPHPEEHLAAIRSFQTILILAKKTPLSSQERATIRHFAQSQGFDLVYLADMQPQETNRFHIIPGDPHSHAFQEVLEPSSRSEFFRQHPYDTRPPMDDHPFFFHYFRPAQIPAALRLFGKVWQPFGGGGYLVLVVLLAFAVISSGVLILLPLSWAPRVEKGFRLAGKRKLAIFGYFSVLGLAFLFVELPLIQYFIFFLGQPTYAFALVLAAILLFSGLGSLWEEKMRGRWRFMALPLLVAIYPWLLRWGPPLLLGLAFPWRAMGGLALLAPLGALMGMPFPTGIRALGKMAPGYIPWAWAVNGCASVVGSILATMLAVTYGFSSVLWLAAGLYGGAMAISIATFSASAPPRS